jgi:ElaB/YqjD/DUF883 family membrane-anchored ribosome-binding protein
MADTIGSPNGASPSENAPATEFGRSIGRDTEATTDTAPSLRDKIGEDITSVKETAQDVAHKAADKAAEVADRQKSYAADQIGKIAGALERVGEELKSDDAGAIGGYASQLGVSAKQFADRVKDKNLSEIAGIAEDFGRRQPLAFLGLAAVAGLAASRFMMASKPTNSTSATSPNAKETYNG